MSNNLNAFFWAKSIAVVGASAAVGKKGYEILRNIIDAGYKEPIYPINPKAGELLGLKAYASLADISKPVDLAVFTIPAAALPGAMEQAGQAGVKAAIVITGGMGEAGNPELEQQVLDTAARFGIRVVGPNCQGIVYTPNSICASWPLLTGQGKVAIISQSGTIGAAMAGWLIDEKIGVSGFISMGNKSDVDECDLLEYFADDPDTAVIALNVEGIKDGARFIDVCSRTTAKEPIVVLKPGISEKGKEAAASHTKSVSGDAAVFTAVCRKAGIIQAFTTQDFIDFVKVLSLAQPISDPQTMIITSSGGSGILAVDEADLSGIPVPDLTDDDIAALKDVLPGHCVIRNPLDLTGDADAQRYLDAIGALGDRPGALMLIYGDPIPEASSKTIEMSKITSQRIICCYIGGGDIQIEETALLQQNGFPVFPTPERTIKAISALYKYGKIQAGKAVKEA